ncbi:MAG: substrate-binding periplasmic protein [Sphingomonadaceae bacterium]
MDELRAATGARRAALLHIAATLITASLPKPAGAAPRLKAALVNIPPWTFGFHSDVIEPFDGAHGIMLDLFEKLAELSGVGIDVIVVPYAREVMMIERGTAILTMALQTPLIDRIAVPLVNLGSEEIIVASRRGSGISSAANLLGKVVAQLRASDYLSEAIDHPQIRKYETVDYAQGVRMLLQGRVDAVIGLRTSLRYAIRQNPRADAVLETIFPLQRRRFGIFMSRQYHDADTTARLRAASLKLLQQRWYDKLRDRYSPQS